VAISLIFHHETEALAALSGSVGIAEKVFRHVGISVTALKNTVILFVLQPILRNFAGK